MSPILEKERQLEPGCELKKFVRNGGEVAYDNTKPHSRIATEHDLGELLEEGGKERLVDDAGFLGRVLSGRYFIDGSSSTCSLRGDPKIARQETKSVVEKITETKTGA